MMATTFTPLYMKDVDLILGDEAMGTNYKCQLRSVVLTPDVNTERIKTLCPDGQFSNVDDPEWNLDLGYLIGEDTADPSLADYLLENQGQKVDFYFAPNAGGPGYKGLVTLIPGPIGGDQGSFSEQSVSLPVDQQPETWAGTGAS
jgi:hypothetical protein